VPGGRAPPALDAAAGARVVTLVFASAVLNWWVPYLAGIDPGEIDPKTFAQEYADSVSVLPPIAGHPVVPDVQYMLIHALVLSSAVLSARVAANRRTPADDRPPGRRGRLRTRRAL
jgi:hypothetical protein